MGYWLVDTAGIGSIIVLAVGFSILVAYITMLRWIQAAPRDPVLVETETGDEEAIAAEAGGEEA
jgi:hypothetical protein